MKLFTCSNCSNLLFFDNVACTRCGATLGFLPPALQMVALVPAGAGTWQAPGIAGRWRMCLNSTQHEICNWMVEAESDDPFCTACRLNRTIPRLDVPGHRELWQTLEAEKRRLVYSLLRLGLPVLPRSADPSGLAFDFLADAPPSFSERGRVLTGHVDGLITINIAEADPAERERMRSRMAEPYRTILGHFRHESGHFYWDRLVRDHTVLEEFRTLFGDERADYGHALDQHYRFGAPANWRDRFVSAYAGAHPWEDWAETWAHYLHIVDTLETAWQYGLRIRARAGGEDAPDARHDFDAYRQPDFELLVDHWLPLTGALNSLARSMGHEHAYPFVLGPAAIAKMEFVHRVVRAAGEQSD